MPLRNSFSYKQNNDEKKEKNTKLPSKEGTLFAALSRAKAKKKKLTKGDR